MKIRSLLWVAIGAAMLVACSTNRPLELSAFDRQFLKTQNCSGANCPVVVTVTENASTGTCSGAVSDAILNLSQGQADKKITWTLSDGYKFSKEEWKYAIVIKTDPKDTIKKTDIQAGGQRLVLDYKRGGGGNSYTYGLNFRRDNGTWCEMLDPFMVD